MTVIRKTQIETNQFQIGDQIAVNLNGFGKFTATVQKIMDKEIVFLFDDIIDLYPMNKVDTKDGGFEQSDLNKFLHETVLRAFPDELQYKIQDITLPTYGEIFGHARNDQFFEQDSDKQFELMKKYTNRIGFFGNNPFWWWLKNTINASQSAAYFAFVDSRGSAYCSNASGSNGVRPKFILIRQEKEI